MFGLGFLIFIGLLAAAVSPFMSAIIAASNGAKVKVETGSIIARVGLFSFVGIVIWYLLSSIVIVQAGDRAAIFNVFTGVRPVVLKEGFHIVPKIINQVSHYDIYTKTFSDIIPCLSSDGLSMTMDVSIRYHINPMKPADIKKHVGEDEDIVQKILIPTARSKMRDITAQFTAQQAYASKRMELQEAYRKLLEDYFGGEGYIVAEQILVREVKPPEALTEKITETKVAEQDVIKQKNVLDAEKQKKEQTIVQAQAQAEALRIKANAIAQNAKVVQLEWINKWDGKLPTYMLGNNTSVLLGMDK